MVKDRISPFVGTDLEKVPRANGIDALVLAGVHTSGVVLSTVRHGGDLDYRWLRRARLLRRPGCSGACETVSTS